MGHAMPTPTTINALQLTKHYAAQVRRDKILTLEPPNSLLRTELQVPDVPGTQLTLEAHIVKGKLQALGYRIRSCSLGQAALGILLQYHQGLTLAQLTQAQQQLTDVLAGTLTDVSQLIWPELALFADAVTLTERHPVALLPFNGLIQLFTQAQTQELSANPSLT